MQRRKTVRLLIWLAALSVATWRCEAFAAGPHKVGRLVKVEVESLLAAHTDRGMDPRLGHDTTWRLRNVFDYTSYVLLKHEHASVGCGQAVAFNLPRGRIL
ncbi:MAG TPA: hypothetical protein VJ718_06080, partial [Candidatus Binataceae bacterium]|nr:hypothetical protein [Candidatus Binataceae bacterium]